MSDFEFLSVLVSIVVGFGLTRLLGGLGRAYHFRGSSKMDVVHAVWTVTTFFVIVLNWWVFLLWRDIELWSFTLFFPIIVWTTSMYTLALALYPPNTPNDVSYRDLWEKNRGWYLGTFAFMTAMDLLVTTMRDGAFPDPVYTAYVGHYTVLTAAGIFIKRRGYDLTIAIWVAVTLIAWSFGVRDTLF